MILHHDGAAWAVTVLDFHVSGLYFRLIVTRLIEPRTVPLLTGPSLRLWVAVWKVNRVKTFCGILSNDDILFWCVDCRFLANK